MSNCHKCGTNYRKNELENLKYLKKLGYTIGKKIGKGKYSRVCVSVCTSGSTQKKLACKIINRKYVESNFVTRFLPREIEIMCKIDHANIVSVRKILEINDVIYMFMDYCKNGDLLEYIQLYGALSENKAKQYFRQIVNAVEYLHNQNVAHRDLKCENIFLSRNNTLKLGDFGFARSFIDEQTGLNILSETYCGSTAYAAPEILKGIPYDPKMYDIWSLGCILFIMLSASMPFDDSNITRMLKCQLDKLSCFTSSCVWQKCSASLMNLFIYILEPDASKRYTIDDVVNCNWLSVHRTKHGATQLLESDTKKAKFM